MSKYIYNLVLSAFLLVLFGCEKEAENIELPDVDPKLVVYCYLSPTDSLIEVELSKSIQFFGENNGNVNDPVKDAIVQISSQGKSTLIPYSTLSESYTIPNNSEFPILAGNSYTLNVVTLDGVSVTSKTTIPAAASLQMTVDIDSTTRNTNGYSEKTYRIITRWNDVPNQLNFYEISVRSFFGDFRDENNSFNICNLYKNDEGVDGQLLSSTCNYVNFDNPDFPGPGFEGKVTLNNTDAAYYLYHRSLSNYQGDNPFAEPSRIYSNIEGGLGCFGSYVKQEIEF